MTQHAITALALASSGGHPRAPIGIIVLVIIVAVVVFFLVRRGPGRGGTGSEPPAGKGREDRCGGAWRSCAAGRQITAAQLEGQD